MFTLVTGVIYIVLEIRQKNFMWVIGILTSLSSMWVFFCQGLYASFGLNAYYLITSFIGLWQWRKDRKKVCTDADNYATGDQIHLNRLSGRIVLLSAVFAFIGIFGLASLMEIVENPMSYMDSSVAVLSAIATWWLVRSYREQWLLWIFIDLLSMMLCASQGMWWMSVLYAAYAVSAIYGLYYWKKHGRYANDSDSACFE